MGEYYGWVNVDRKEYIRPIDFDYGSKSHESCGRNSAVLRALRDLLSKEWKGCRICWMGDECSLPEDISNSLFSIIKIQCDETGYHGNIYDATVYGTYKNVSGLFKSAEEEVRKEIEYYLYDIAHGDLDESNEYGVDPQNPFEGLFQRTGIDSKYTINYTKGVCYSFDDTKILHQNGEESDFADPLPILMGYGRVMDSGEWLGDIIGVSDELPEGIKVLDRIMLDW